MLGGEVSVPRFRAIRAKWTRQIIFGGLRRGLRFVSAGSKGSQAIFFCLVGVTLSTLFWQINSHECLQ